MDFNEELNDNQRLREEIVFLQMEIDHQRHAYNFQRNLNNRRRFRLTRLPTLRNRYCIIRLNYDRPYFLEYNHRIFLAFPAR